MKWATQIANAVSALHDVGVAHRDLKLENFVLRDDGSVCLIDFGVSAAYGKHGQSVANARATSGSTVYAPPELQKTRKRDSITSTLTATATTTATVTTSPATSSSSGSLLLVTGACARQ